MTFLNLLASIALQSDDGTGALIGASVAACCWLIVAVVFIAAMWKIFVKAGQPGWAASWNEDLEPLRSRGGCVADGETFLPNPHRRRVAIVYQTTTCRL